MPRKVGVGPLTSRTTVYGIAAGDGQGKPGLGTGIIDALAKPLGATVTTTDRAPGTKVSIVRPI
jgi:hypothetical protein